MTKSYMVLVDKDEALREFYINNELVWIERCWTKKEAERIMEEYEQRQYDIIEASTDMDGEFEIE